MLNNTLVYLIANNERKRPSEGFEPSSSGFYLLQKRPQPPILTRLYYEGHAFIDIRLY